MRSLKNRWLRGAGLLLAVLLVTSWLWPAENERLQGRYASQGMLLLASGSAVQVSHAIQFSDQRFYGLSRQENVIVEISGHVEKRQRDNYQLIVEKGGVTGLDGTADNHSLFAHLFSSRPGTVINLTAVDDCLYAIETSQVYCSE